MVHTLSVHFGSENRFIEPATGWTIGSMLQMNRCPEHSGCSGWNQRRAWPFAIPDGDAAPATETPTMKLGRLLPRSLRSFSVALGFGFVAATTAVAPTSSAPIQQVCPAPTAAPAAAVDRSPEEHLNASRGILPKKDLSRPGSEDGLAGIVSVFSPPVAGHAFAFPSRAIRCGGPRAPPVSRIL